MDTNKEDNNTTNHEHKQTSVNGSLEQTEQLRAKERPESIKPLARALFQPIQSFAKTNDLSRVLTALGSIYIYITTGVSSGRGAFKNALQTSVCQRDQPR